MEPFNVLVGDMFFIKSKMAVMGSEGCSWLSGCEEWRQTSGVFSQQACWLVIFTKDRGYNQDYGWLCSK